MREGYHYVGYIYCSPYKYHHNLSLFLGYPYLDMSDCHVPRQVTVYVNALTDANFT